MTMPKLSPTKITSTPAELITEAKVDSYAVKQVNFSEFFLNLFKVLNVTIFLFDLVDIIIN